MTPDRPFHHRAIDGAAEFSKTIDKIAIPIGGGIWLFGNPALGGTIIVASGLGIIAANKIQETTR